MDANVTLPLRDTNNRFRLLLSTMRTSIVEIVLKLSFLGETWSEEGAEEIETLFKSVNEAKADLDAKLQRDFRRMSIDIPENMENSRVKLLEQLDLYIATARDTLKAVKTKEKAGERLRDLDTGAGRKTRAAIDEFRNQLSTFVENEDGRRANKERNLISTAIAQIDHISTSINLISVNASVEAARAGEFGKGFAVIAAEIQSLSSQSKQAVEDIRAGLKA